MNSNLQLTSSKTKCFFAVCVDRFTFNREIKLLLGLFLLALLGSAPLFSQNWQLIQPTYPTTDAFVAGFSVKDFGAAGDGQTDVTNIFQQKLDSLGKLGGGTLFVPAGKYVIKGALLIPKGVILRGEWERPVKGAAVKGTILMAYTGKGDENAPAFITMEPTAGIEDLAIWYPEQSADNITPYSPAIMFGKPGYWGNDFCNAKHITFVNAYAGLVFSRINGGSCPMIDGLYGTPLSRGLEIDNIADVGHIQNIDFSPAYWAGSGLPGAPASGSGYATWIYNNGTGVVMRRNDWSYTSFVNIEGYRTGFHAAPSIASPGAVPNGQNYEMTFTNCATAIDCEVVNSDGILFSRVNMTGCTVGLKVGGGASTDGTVQLHSCQISGSDYAIQTDSGCIARVILQKCKVDNGKVEIGGGTFMASDNDFQNSAPQIVLGSKSRGIITGNRFKNDENIQNNSQYISRIDDTPLDLPELPALPDVLTKNQKPARLVMYLATSAPFNAKNDGVTDNTAAVQAAIDKAANEGGGVVFLPPGKYKFLGHLRIPTGVELKGATDDYAAPMGQGTIIEPYADQNNVSGDPFIIMEENSGLRGVTINYPEQLASNLPNLPKYPYTIQGRGKDIYIVNVGLRAVYNGIDLFSYKCNDHYIANLTGHVFNHGIRVGAGSENGIIANCQFNTGVYASGAESKWGSWANSPTGDNGFVYDYNFNNLDFLVLGNCANETLYNNFIYGARTGVIFSQDGGKGPSGVSLGTGLDGTRTGIRFDAIGTGGFDLINSQIVSLGDDTTYSYLETTPSFTGKVNLFNTDLWGNPGKSIISNGSGTLNLQSANFQNAGHLRFANINAGEVKLQNSVIWPVGSLLNATGATGFSAGSSLLDYDKLDTTSMPYFKNNLTNEWLASVKGALDRHGWTATASANASATGNALDSVASSRWDTQGAQTNGQYFEVDMQTNNTVHSVILDNTQSAGDSPAGYELYVLKNSDDPGTLVASGTGTTGMTLISFPETVGRLIRVVQTGQKGNYWSIHEFYAFGSVNVDSVRLDTLSKTILVGASHILHATVYPLKATSKALNWQSSDPSIAKVDDNGQVTGVAPGVATITVTTLDGQKTAVCKDTVVNQAPGEITPPMDNETMRIFPNPLKGRTLNLSMTHTGQPVAMQVEIYNAAAVCVYKSSLKLETGKKVYPLVLQQKLSPGVYYVRVNAKGQPKKTFKLMVL